MNFIELANYRIDQKEQSFIKGGNTGVACSSKCHGDYNAMVNKVLANMREKNPIQNQDTIKTDTIS